MSTISISKVEKYQLRVNTVNDSRMGVKGLTKLLSSYAPESIRAIDGGLAYYRGKRVAFDASMHIYQFMTSIRTDRGETLTDASGNPTSHLQGMISRVSKLLEAGIYPVFVFDGPPPDAKMALLTKRRDTRMANQARAEEALLAHDINNAAMLQRRSYSLSDREVEDCKKLLRILGIPVIDAPSEAEAQCAVMCRDGLVHGVSSEDMDTLAFGAPLLIRNMFNTTSIAGAQQTSKYSVTEIDLHTVIQKLNLDNMDQFVDLCILCGCDYCGTIPGIGPVRALQRIRDCGNIDGVLASMSTGSSSATHEKLREFKYQEARRLFKTPNVTASSNINLTWDEPKFEELRAFLVDEKLFNAARVDRFIERVMKGIESRKQLTIDSMFTRRK